MSHAVQFSVLANKMNNDGFESLISNSNSGVVINKNLFIMA